MKKEYSFNAARSIVGGATAKLHMKKFCLGGFNAARSIVGGATQSPLW